MTDEGLVDFVVRMWPMVCPGQPLDRALLRRIADVSASMTASTAGDFIHLTDCLRRPGATVEEVARELAAERARSLPAGVDPFRPGARDPGRRRSEPPIPRWARRR